MHLILTGATGLIGSSVLDAMLKMKDVTKISVLSRRPVPMAEQANDPRVKVIIHKDFTKYGSDVLGELRGATGAVWALGTSQNKVSSEELVTITKDYTLAGAKAFADLAPGDEPFRFIFVSGMGATQAPGMFTPRFGSVKGETETALDEMRAANPRFAAESVRPSGVDASDHAAIKPFLPDPGLIYKTMSFTLVPAIKTFQRSMHAPTEPLGKFLAEMAAGKHQEALKHRDIVTLGGGLRLIENSSFRRIMGLS